MVLELDISVQDGESPQWSPGSSIRLWFRPSAFVHSRTAGRGGQEMGSMPGAPLACYQKQRGRCVQRCGKWRVPCRRGGRGRDTGGPRSCAGGGDAATWLSNRCRSRWRTYTSMYAVGTSRAALTGESPAGFAFSQPISGVPDGCVLLRLTWRADVQSCNDTASQNVSARVLKQEEVVLDPSSPRGNELPGTSEKILRASKSSQIFLSVDFSPNCK